MHWVRHVDNCRSTIDEKVWNAQDPKLLRAIAPVEGEHRVGFKPHVAERPQNTDDPRPQEETDVQDSEEETEPAQRLCEPPFVT